MLVVEIAKYLDQLDLVTFDESGVSGDCFIAGMPPQPTDAVALYPTGGPGSDSKLGYDEPTFQVRVRGRQHPVPAFDRAQAIYDALHGLTNAELPGGTWLVSLLGIQSDPVYIGRDDNNRPEYTLNFRAEIRNVSTHRV